MTITINGTTGISGVDGTASTPAIQGNDTNTGMFFPAADTIAFAEGGAEVARFDSSGNLGIGTSSPSYKLDAQIALTGTAAGDNTALYLGSLASGRDVNIRFGDSVNASARLGYLSGALYMYTNGSERARIDSSGNLLVGTTDAVGRLTVNRTSGSWSASFRGANASGNILIGNQSGTSAYDAIVFTNSGFSTQTGNITVNSNGTTSYSSASDYRLKENIAPMTGALSKVQALKPVTYTWKADGSEGQGFIAHELAEVVPDAVTGEKDAVDAEGKIKPQTIDTSFLVATLTAALQEAHGLIKDLQARVETLEAK